MTYKRHLKKFRSLKLGLSFIIGVASLLIIGRLFLVARASQWRGTADFSWIDQQGDRLTVYTIIPEYAKLVTWPLPGNALVTTAFGYGQYQWKNVFALGEIESQGGVILSRTSQNTLGLPIKGWRVNRKTNLTWWDRLRWWYSLQFTVKRRVVVDLNQNGAWQENVLADGSPVLEPVEYRLDQVVNAETFSQQAAAESLSLSLVNGSNLSRVISNHGIEVVAVSNQPQDPEQSVIWVKTALQKNSLTVRWLKALIPQAEIKVGGGETPRSDLVLTIGKDYN